jgi:hypothetical protein
MQSVNLRAKLNADLSVKLSVLIAKLDAEC